VLILGEHRVYAEVLAMMLWTDDRVETCKAVVTADEATLVTRRGTYDVAVLDLPMPGARGLDAAVRLRVEHPDLRLVVLTRYAGLDALALAAQCGVHAFLPMDASFVEVRAAALDHIDGHLSDGGLLAAVADRIRLEEERRQGEPPLSLTPREREVLAFLADGATVTDIAGFLGLSVQTCRGYVKSLLAKLGVRTQLQAVVAAARMGLLSVGRPGYAVG
jgi:DNA-binding NarL/FixJ family response regulator